MTTVEFTIEGSARAVDVQNLIVAGWTGRDQASVNSHIAELEAIGVAPPRTTPMFYRLGSNLLTTAASIDVTGEFSSGEVEYVLVASPHGLFVGVGSDHTDRKVEAYGVTVSKQICPKPVGPHLWPLTDIYDHWDECILRSWVTRDQQRRLYQEGPVTKMLSPADLIHRFAPGVQLPAGTVMFCGTLPTIGSIEGGESFEMELHDPRLSRSLHHAYNIRTLAYAD